jgi:DNA-binding transcriptional regulator YiaG
MTPEEVAKLRESLEMTQEDLARYLGLRHKSQVAHLESGRTRVTGPVLRLLRLLEDTDGKILEKIRE